MHYAIYKLFRKFGLKKSFSGILSFLIGSFTALQAYFILEGEKARGSKAWACLCALFGPAAFFIAAIQSEEPVGCVKSLFGQFARNACTTIRVFAVMACLFGEALFRSLADLIDWGEAA